MAKEFMLSIYTPKHLFFQGEVKELNIKIAYGSIGLLADHVPIISSIQTCIFSIEGRKKTKKKGVILGGIIFFEKNEAKIFTSNVVWKDNINITNVKSKINFYENKLKEKNLSNYELKNSKSMLLFYNLQK